MTVYIIYKIYKTRIKIDYKVCINEIRRLYTVIMDTNVTAIFIMNII